MCIRDSSYLGSQINYTNISSTDFEARIPSGNQCYYIYSKIIKSKSLKRLSKLKIYSSIMKPVVTYACETCVLTHKREQYVGIFK